MVYLQRTVYPHKPRSGLPITQTYSRIIVNGVARGDRLKHSYVTVKDDISNRAPALGCKYNLKLLNIFLHGSMLPHHMPRILWSDRVSKSEKKVC